MSDWRTEYEEHEGRETARLSRLSDDELLSIIRRRATNGSYGIWRVLGARTPTRVTCWTLYGVLQGDWDYLDKYHCADALLALLRSTAFEAVELSADWPVVPENLRRLHAIIEATVGGPA